MWTEKQDWFNTLLAKRRALVSSATSFSSNLALPDRCTAELRFVRHQDRIQYLLTLNSGTVLSNRPAALQLVRSMVRASKGPFEQIVGVFGETIQVLLYSNEQPNRFWVYDPHTRQLSAKDSHELEELFQSLLPGVTQGPGTSKEVNKSINDAFQRWTRQHLTRRCTVNDIDALQLSGEHAFASQPIVYELKRVNENLETWKPYTDDYYNYVALYAVADDIGGQARTVAYNKTGEKAYVAVHILSMAKSSPKKLVGTRMLIKPDDVAMPGWGTAYESTNRRQS